MKDTHKKEIILYLTIVYGITYAAFGICKITGMDYKNFVSYSMLIPSFAAVSSTLIFKDKFSYITNNLKINKCIPLGVLIMISIYINVIILEAALYMFIIRQPGILRIPSIFALSEQITIGITIAALFAFLEEIGWRGFLQNNLALKNNFSSYFIVGLCWTVFHFPQIFDGLMYKGHMAAGLVIHTCILVSFGALLCYMREKSSSLICTSIMHGLFNVLIFTEATSVISEGNQLIEGTLWAILFLSIITVLFFISFNSKRKNIADSLNSR